jgi:predicted nucleic acid-binding protein
MAIGGAEDVFVDTNVLVFATVAEAPLHATARRAIQEQSENGATIWISRQVLREFLAVLTRPQTFNSPPPVATVVQLVQGFETSMRVAEEGHEVTDHLLALLQSVPTGGKQVHDANIVATMQTYGIRRLLTHNTTDFARFSPFIAVVPLVAAQ